MKQNVYFNIRPNARERMWDTVRQAVAVCSPSTPEVTQQSSIALSAKNKSSLLPKLKRAMIHALPLLNRQHVSPNAEVDVLYMWGAFPKGSDKPYIVELDNPYVLSYYNTQTFGLRRREIQRRLRKARKITYLSSAARNHTIELLGDEFAEKSVAFPPYMERNYTRNARPNDGITRFLFVGLDFRRKGGPELLKAFSQLDARNVQLTVTSRVDESTQNEYEHDTRITFLPPQSREKLLGEIYPTHDIFVFPSFHESLGVVVLEALSYGMGIIATDVYATPEMVTDGHNGRLLPHPVLTPRIFNGVPTIDCVSLESYQFAEKYLTEGVLHESLVSDLHGALTQATTQAVAWQQASEAIFEEQYAPDVWRSRFEVIVNT